MVKWIILYLLKKSFRMLRKAVSVLPEPVGLETRTFSLFSIKGTAIACGGVKSLNFSLNHFLTKGSKRLSISPLLLLSLMYFTMLFISIFA